MYGMAPRLAVSSLCQSLVVVNVAGQKRCIGRVFAACLYYPSIAIHNGKRPTLQT